MPSPAWAFAWEFGRRHRWGFAAVAGYLAALVVFRLLGSGAPLDPDAIGTFFAVAVVPVTAAFFYFAAIFSFGMAGDVTARASMYPRRLFTLPLATEALARWPMLLGAAAMATLWLAARLLAPIPPGLEVPLAWPGVVALVFLAWTQVLVWMPYGLPGLRVAAAVVWLTAVDAVVFTAIELRASESLMVLLLAPQLPLAYLCARVAVTRARRGEVPDWRGLPGRLLRRGALRPPRSFRSPARAQLWFEWRRHGRVLPGWVALLLPFELALLFVAGPAHPRLILVTLAAVLLTPPFVAAFVAPSGAMSPFLAARPLPTATLVRAKLTVALASTAAAWLLVLVAVPLALTLSGTWSLAAGWGRGVVEAFGPARATVLAGVTLAALVAATWKQLVQGLCLGLSGRAWLVKGSVFVRLSLLIAIIPLVQWVLSPSGFVAAWNALPATVAALAAGKVGAGMWIAARLHRSRVIEDRALVGMAASWTLLVLLVYGLLVWLVSSPPFVPRFLPALAAILLVPLARPAAMPLALAWSRHR